MNESSQNFPIIFPVHPRTANILKQLKLTTSNIYFIEPLNYLEFNYLIEKSLAVLTDPGGISEETTFFGVPCLTLRDSPERPKTVTIGTNELVGNDFQKIEYSLKKIIAGGWKIGKIPEKWNGKSGRQNCLPSQEFKYNRLILVI